jgi:hypothetical protein
VNTYLTNNPQQRNQKAQSRLLQER